MNLYNAIYNIIILFPISCIFPIRTVMSQSQSQEQVLVNNSTLHGKIMAGYQGWFMTPNDNGLNRWRHWATEETPNPNTIEIDLWPDLSDFNEDDLYPSDFIYYEENKENRVAGLYSNNNMNTAMIHMKWMKEYNIHGVFVQRFVIEAMQMRNVRDNVLQNIRHASQKYGRVFANMYDISGWHKKTSLIEDIKQDWIHLVDDLKITESSQYLYHNGKPVLAIWGFGFKSRPSDPKEALELIQWLQIEAPLQYQACVMGGVPTGWREEVESNNNNDSDWSEVYRAFDVISPWSVGRYKGLSGADYFLRNYIEPDLKMTTNVIGNEYMPVVFPGFSFRNSKPNEKPFNEMPRYGGTFFWRQLYNAIVEAGNQMVYVAMFDELDEGTAIYKVAETKCDVPINGRFVTLDEDDGYDCVPNDWYMKLMGDATFYLEKGDQNDIMEMPKEMPNLPICEKTCDRTYSPTPVPTTLPTTDKPTPVPYSLESSTSAPTDGLDHVIDLVQHTPTIEPTSDKSLTPTTFVHNFGMDSDSSSSESFIPTQQPQLQLQVEEGQEEENSNDFTSNDNNPSTTTTTSSEDNDSSFSFGFDTKSEIALSVSILVFLIVSILSLVLYYLRSRRNNRDNFHPFEDEIDVL